MNFTGYITKVNTKTGVGKRGPWTLYSAQINDTWVSCGFDPPAFKEGDYVTLDVAEKEYKGKKQYDLLPDTVKKVDPPKEAQPSAPASANGGPNTQAQISWQAARNSAIAVVDLLLKVEGLPLPAKAKRTEAVVYDIVTAAINKLTVQYHNDTQTLRVLETVQDAGALEEPEDAAGGEATDADA